MQKNTYKKQITGFLLLIFAFGLFPLKAPMVEAQTAITATCLDTIAGYSALCKTSVLTPNTEITFKITKPDTTIVRFPCKTDLTGKASCDVNYFHTRQAGTFKVSAFLSTEKESKNMNEKTFEVFADKVSPAVSTAKALKLSVAADGMDASYITINVKDQYGNPLKDRMVNIVSSRTEDVIEKVGNKGLSNEEGLINIKVSSKTPGVSTYIIQDKVDNVTLTERPKIVFYKASSAVNTPSTSGSQAYKANIFETQAMGGPIASLQLTTPENVQVNVPFDVTVSALDSNGTPAISYRGTIFFSSPGDVNASLPLQEEGYTFSGTETNASHTFSKAAIFSTTGTHRLVVTDVDNPDIEAEKIITVTNGSSTNSNNNPTTAEDIIVLSPKTGSTYGASTLEIMGKISPNTKYSVEDNDIEIGKKVSDAEGNFIFETKTLADGKHSFVVTTLDNSDTPLKNSEELIVFIDTSMPVLEDISFDPEENLSGGMSIEATLKSEPKLSKAQVVIDDVAYDLQEEEEDPGVYIGNVTLPEEEGTYDINVKLANTLGKEASPSTNKKLVVAAKQTIEISDFKVETGENEDELLLSWKKLEDFADFGKYVISYDTTPLNLSKTQEITSNASSYSLRDLEPGTGYYVSLTLLDKNGKELTQSDILPGETKKKALAFENLTTISEDSKITLTWDDMKNQKIKKYKISYGVKAGEYLESVMTKDSTPTWYVPDLINGTTYYFKIMALDEDNTELIASEEVHDTAGGEKYHSAACTISNVKNVRIIVRGNQRVLTWDPVPGITTYNVYSGTTQGLFNMPTRQVHENFFLIPEGQNVKQYYFAVKGICDNGQESIDFSNILKVQVGPASILVILLSLAGIYFIRRKYKFVK